MKCRSAWPLAVRGWLPWSDRVSTTRSGNSELYSPPVAPNQPMTSAITWDDAAPGEKHTLPSVPSLTAVRPGTFSPCEKLRFEAVGRGEPHGHTVRKPLDDVSVDVALSTTAAASAGVPFPPPTWTSPVAFTPTAPAGTPPVPLRVSR